MNQFNFSELHQYFCRAYVKVKAELSLNDATYGVFAPISTKGTAITFDCYELPTQTPFFWGLVINDQLDAEEPIMGSSLVGIYLSFVQEANLIGVFLDVNLIATEAYRTPLAAAENAPLPIDNIYETLPILKYIERRSKVIPH